MATAIGTNSDVAQISVKTDVQNLMFDSATTVGGGVVAFPQGMPTKKRIFLKSTICKMKWKITHLLVFLVKCSD